MAIYLEIPKLNKQFPFRTLLNEGDILTTPHWHKELEIIYVSKGVIHMGIEDEAIEAVEGDFVLVAGGRVHYVLASPGSVRYVFQFDEKFFHDLMLDQCERDSLRFLWRDYPAHSQKWQGQTADTVKFLLKSIFKEDKNREQAYAFAVKGYMCLIILLMYRNREKRDYGPESKYHADSNRTLKKLDLIFRYVEENYMHPITLDEIAGYMAFSTYYFTRFFKRNVGKTFVQFLNEYRIEKAKWILLNEDIGALELVERIGIGSTKTYYRLFKEIVGMTPKEYRQKNIQE